ncbi:hypothetical protein GIB67_019751 [Kingdonia uniflora]|uniref:Uncharacterized protein n=1 Tax=Kingdonia uniflora TaxID=39325 RepID=A0A7J7MJY4_9MAGN|nr:hypothetical protein GIB67_019751 [Kingdonia uniflora]
MRSKPSIPTSIFVVASSFEETSSSRRGDECSMSEEIISSVEKSIEGWEPSKVNEVMERRDRSKKERVLVIYPEGVDVGKKYLKYKKKLQGEWGSYVEKQGLRFRSFIPGKGDEAVYYQVSSLAKWKKDRWIGEGFSLSYYNGREQSGPRDGFLCFLNQPKPLSTPNKTSLFDYVAQDLNELKQLGRVPLSLGAATTQEITKSISGDVVVNLEVAPVEVEKSSLKIKRHEEEGSSRTKPHTSAKMAELEFKCCSMAAMDPEQLDAEYYEHTFALSMLLKVAKNCLEQKNKEFEALTARFEAQSARLKEFKDQFARVMELKAELKLEKEQRVEEAKTAVKLVTKYSDLVAHDDMMLKFFKALKVE